MERHYFTCSDKKELFYRVWKPENNNILGAVHILHGMAEHGQRYDRFALYLNSIGFAVYAQDHRGHGQSASDDDLGWFAAKHGWQRVVQDTIEISEFIKKENPGVKLFLFGHSMGSFIARSVIVERDDLYTGVILSGTATSKGLIGKVGRLIASTRSLFNGGKKPDSLLDTMSFGSFAAQFEERETDFDWLSKDSVEVKKYIDDPLCGFICSSRFFVDLLDGVDTANSVSKANNIRKDLPLFIISGENDPVGEFTKGVSKVFDLYQGVGISDLEMTLIKGGRHELLNETNYDEIHTIIGSWLTKHCK